MNIIEHNKTCKDINCKDINALFAPCDICDRGGCFKHAVAKNTYLLHSYHPDKIMEKTIQEMDNFYNLSTFENIMRIYRTLLSEQIKDPAAIDQLREIDKILSELIGPNFN